MVPITQKLLPLTPEGRRSGLKNLGIKYIVAHDTGNDGSTAMQNVNYYISSAAKEQASAHYFVDDGAVINCIPENEKAWHVRYSAGIAPNVSGNFANDVALGIELCFGSTWSTMRNLTSYNNYCALIASLCKRYNIDPSVGIVSHTKLDPTRRTDPLNAFKYIGKTWEQFIADVTAFMTPDPLVTIQIPKSKLDRVLAYINTL